MTEIDVMDLSARVENLTPPNRLRLAAELLEARRADLAYALIDRVKVELGAALMMEKR